MIIDAHLHLSVFKKVSTFKRAKKKLLSDIKKNKIDYAIMIPDNLHGSTIGNLDVSLELIKNEKNFFY